VPSGSTSAEGITKPPVAPWLLTPNPCACKGALSKAHKLRLSSPQFLAQHLLPGRFFAIVMLKLALKRYRTLSLEGISNNADFVILSEAKNLLFAGSKKRILRPAASE
jgi:hypothetical protein